MGQQKKVYQWAETLRQHMHALSLPQVKAIARFSMSVILSGSCVLSRAAEAMPGSGSPGALEKRFYRFLKSSRVDLEAAGRDLARWVLSNLSAKDTVVLLVDETYHTDRLKAMVVSVAHEGRAIPVAWRCYKPDEWPMGQVELIRTLLLQVKGVLPPGVRVLVEADRGIGTSPDLVRMIEEPGWWYLVRVQGQVRIQADNRESAFSQLVSAPGMRFKGRVKAFKGAGWIECFALGEWSSGQKGPWLLLTNHPDAGADWYGIRWYEECAFKDFKGSQTIPLNRLGSLQVPGLRVGEEQGLGPGAGRQALACACPCVRLDGEPGTEDQTQGRT